MLERNVADNIPAEDDTDMGAGAGEMNVDTHTHTHTALSTVQAIQETRAVAEIAPGARL